jgi:glutamine amidotransferase
MKIAIIDYGMGNIKSIVSALKYLGVTDITVTSDETLLRNADKLILPGVGSFNQAMGNIKEKAIDTCLKSMALEDKKPILGICLGMQLMGLSSTEDGLTQGLGLVDGLVTKFELEGLRVPHVGFNQVVVNTKSKLYSGIQTGSDFYFTHSYKMKNSSNINQSECEYSEKFVASFEVDNIVGTQFHPELSQTNGLKILINFIEKF